MDRTFTVLVEFDPDSRLYVGSVPGISGAHSQAETLDELSANMREVLELVLEEHASRGEPVENSSFLGLHQITVSI